MGAGPAGLAAAIRLARGGWQVTVVDRRARVEQKICGEFLSPPSRGILERLGAWERIPASARRENRSLTLVSAAGSRLALHFGEEGAWTIPRPALDGALEECARAAGARIVRGRTVVSLERETALGGAYRVGTREGEEFRARVLAGADGRHSWVARELGWGATRPHAHRRTAVMGIFRAPDRTPSGVEMHVTGWGYVGINPLPGGELNVIAVLKHETLRQHLRGSPELLPLLGKLTSSEASPSLRAALEGSSPAQERTWSTANLAWAPSRIAGEDAALIGDASGFVDPFTGEGLYHSLASADKFAETLLQSHPLENYARWHHGRFDGEDRFCLLLQKILPHPALTDLMFRRLASRPLLSRAVAEVVADRAPTDEILSPLFIGKLLWPADRKAA
ncbi:MAG: NAD(P)/FAD-dependent oxidoreductase [Bdellovibrionota bacterium]